MVHTDAVKVLKTTNNNCKNYQDKQKWINNNRKRQATHILAENQVTGPIMTNVSKRVLFWTLSCYYVVCLTRHIVYVCAKKTFTFQQP